MTEDQVVSFASISYCAGIQKSEMWKRSSFGRSHCRTTVIDTGTVGFAQKLFCFTALISSYEHNIVLEILTTVGYIIIHHLGSVI
ncbi:hypothetical protein B9Z55_015576 [Caenorhabditis nigoni]|uniref:Uncharacterized protein n=1 Tax=Caenorhabditis nigoni TaxID=1611254 RepID=A0A2G5UAU1_9PELO|nr:hypothetical protein B9Z55_015576 [Caenorhabditis nigoni]